MTMDEAKTIVAAWLADGADVYLDPSANSEVMQALRTEREALHTLLREEVLPVLRHAIADYLCGRAILAELRILAALQTTPAGR